MQPKLIFREEQYAQLTQKLSGSDGSEHVAFMLFGSSRVQRNPWTQAEEITLTCHEVWPVPDEQLVARGPDRVTWSNDLFIPFLKRAKNHGLIAGIAHNHGTGFPHFSPIDDEGERGLLELARNRNGRTAALVSLLWCESRLADARLWMSDHYPLAIGSHAVLGRRFRFLSSRHNAVPNEALSRQALVFGEHINSTLRALRVAVVGCGGTGSAVATLLARLGVGNLALIDKDAVELSNLNRLHGASFVDAVQQRQKTDVVAGSVLRMGLGTQVSITNAWISDPVSRDILRSCHVIFGCTDDHQGRLFLNRFAYYYLIPVIDTGLAIQVSNDTPPTIQCLDGRYTFLFPGATCLICRGIVNPRRAAEEGLRRSQPEEFARQKAEAYVLGEANPNPAVVTFTTEVATMAVDELLQRLVGYRGDGGSDDQRTRKFNLMRDLRPGDRPLPDCPICGSPDAWGRADTDPFLDMVT